MSMITAIELSKAKQITECLSLLSDPSFLSRNDIPRNACSVFEAAKKSLAEASKASTACLKIKVQQSVRHNHASYWNSTLDHLQNLKI